MDFLDCLVYRGVTFQFILASLTMALQAQWPLRVSTTGLVTTVNSSNWGENLAVTSSRVVDSLNPIVECGCQASLYSPPYVRMASCSRQKKNLLARKGLPGFAVGIWAVSSWEQKQNLNNGWVGCEKWALAANCTLPFISTTQDKELVAPQLTLTHKSCLCVSQGQTSNAVDWLGDSWNRLWCRGQGKANADMVALPRDSPGW